MKRARWLLSLPFDAAVLILFGMMIVAGFVAQYLNGDDL